MCSVNVTAVKKKKKVFPNSSSAHIFKWNSNTNLIWELLIKTWRLEEHGENHI